MRRYSGTALWSRRYVAVLRDDAITRHCHVIIPKLYEKDLADVPEEAKQKLKFVPVENVDEVLAVALEKDGATAPAGT
jgi:ATP-dependent Lon protease